MIEQPSLPIQELQTPTAPARVPHIIFPSDLMVFGDVEALKSSQRRGQPAILQ
jgi:hypothetical protein